MFSIIRTINKHRTVSVELLLDLFDKMILPIAMYNSEVWGMNLIPTNLNNNAFFSSKNLSNTNVEGLQYKFVKLILGLHSKASNWAVLSETGRYPIVIKVFMAMIKYLFHLNNAPSKILHAALAVNMGLARDGYMSWFKSIVRILKFCNLEHLLYTIDIKEIDFQVRNLKKNLQALYTNVWKSERLNFQTDSKLDLFTALKKDFGISDYLRSLTISPHRMAITKFRVSAHRFPIEIGRYLGIHREDRMCPFGCNKIGDEQHYLLQCSHPFLINTRNPLIATIFILNPHLVAMARKAQCHFLLSNTDPKNLELVGKLCYQIQSIFKEITT